MAKPEKRVLSHESFKQLIETSDFKGIGQRSAGKVRESYQSDDRRILITTDRLSCFDVVLTTIPYKGQVLNQLAQFWFERTADIVPNHIVAIPDPNIMVVKNCQVLPVEVVVRGYLAGSAWRDYQAGRAISGITLPAGMQAYQKLSCAMLTPSTKAVHGDHDQPISSLDVVEKGIVSAELWSRVSTAALALFARGQEIAAAHGLILADTKYEFGTLNGELVLVDEIHTLDSSRFWIAESYQSRLGAGEPPVMLDKEPVRQWLLARGFSGEGTPPEFSDQHRLSIASEYIYSYELITGKTFEHAQEDPVARMDRVLDSYRN